MIKSLKEERKAAWKISGRRVSLSRRTERTKVLVSPVGLGKCERGEQTGWRLGQTKY